jgi:hypothetical protein
MILDNTCVVPLVTINSEDCIGDTVGKYNYNALALDTTICNLSSYIYASKAFDDLPYLIDTYSGFYDTINTALYNEFKKAATTVNLLSSYWGHYEFSVQMPINAVSLSSNDTNILALRLSTVNLQSIESLVQSNLKSLTETFLNIEYPPTSYINYTIVNVTFFIYNLIPVIKDPQTNVDPLVRTKIYPIASYNYNNRLIEATYRRDNVHVSTGVVLRFIVEDRKWIYIGYYLNDDVNTASPNYNNQVIRQLPEEPKITANESKNILGFCEPIKENTWYSLEKYVYANSLYSGTSNKLGTITITLRTPSNNIEYFSYKASGYNPNTNTGGTDVFIEINGTVINVYEQYPIKKTLVKSWINPFSEVKGVNFKFTKDSKGVSFSACASTNII